MSKLIIIAFVFSILNSSRANYLDENLNKVNWNGIEVIWLEDDSLPTYDFIINFDEGAFGDKNGFYGETQLMFDLMATGTSSFSEKEILEQLEFYGAGFDTNITHEFSSMRISGLVKDIKPTLEMVCHVFKNANYPKAKLKSFKDRKAAEIKSMVTKHSALASLVFRYESLRATGYENPVKGTLDSMSKITRDDLKERLNYFNEEVPKRIYIRGPKKSLIVKSIILNECGWKKINKPKSKKEINPKALTNVLYFVKVPDANQAQIRIGRTLNSAEVNLGKHELKSFTSSYLGGGFTSRLVQELRVKKGLTYSASSYVSEQKDYGRAGINTFTKNSSIVEMLKSIKSVVNYASKNISSDEFEMAKRSIKGNFLLSLESSSSFLQNLQYYDHIGRDYDSIYKFSNIIDKVSKNDMKKMIDKIFNWNSQVKLVLGDKSLIKVLKDAGYKVVELNYKDYL